MVDVSNRTLATLLVAAIVISLGGTIISLDRLGGLTSLTGQAIVDTADAPSPPAEIVVVDHVDAKADEEDESVDDADTSESALE